MKRFSEQFHKKSKSVTLQAIERDALKARIVSYMEYHPIDSTAPILAKPPAIHSPYFDETFKTIPVPTAMILRWSAVFSVLLLTIIPVLAQQAFPGDKLYSVKVHFNEEVRSTLTFNQSDKIVWETERLNRRIAEARVLANEGKLTSEVSAQVVASVLEHTEHVQAEIATLRKTDADGATLASIELSTTLQTQSTSLQQDGNTVLASALSDAQPSSVTPTQALVDVINETISKQDTETDAAAVPGYDKIIARIEQNTTRSYELLSTITFADNDPLKTAIDRRLQDIGRSVQDANLLRSKDEGAASKALIDTLERTQKLIVFMSDLDVNQGVDLETVVPTVLTADEKEQQLVQINIDINHKIEILTTLRPKLNTATAEKVEASIKVAKLKLDEFKANKESINGRNYAKDTITLLDDALKLVAASGVSINTPAETPESTASSTATTTSEEGTQN